MEKGSRGVRCPVPLAPCEAGAQGERTRSGQVAAAVALALAPVVSGSRGRCRRRQRQPLPLPPSSAAAVGGVVVVGLGGSGWLGAATFGSLFLPSALLLALTACAPSRLVPCRPVRPVSRSVLAFAFSLSPRHLRRAAASPLSLRCVVFGSVGLEYKRKKQRLCAVASAVPSVPSRP